MAGGLLQEDVDPQSAEEALSLQELSRDLALTALEPLHMVV